MRTSITLFFVILVCCFPARSPSQAQQGLDLQQCIEEALRANPELAALHKKREAMWERPAQEKAWDDPELSFGFANLNTDNFDFNQIDMTMKQIAISQNIPMPGITTLREKIAIQDAKTADKVLESGKLKLIKDVKNAYYDLYINFVHMQTAEKNKALMGKFIDIAYKKYEVGQGLQQDILKAQVELSKILERLVDLEQKKKSYTAEMNRLLSRDPGRGLDGISTVIQRKVPLAAEELQTAAIENNPILHGLQHAIERSEADYRLAQKQYFPSFNMNAMYGQREGYREEDGFVPATIMNRYDASSEYLGRLPGKHIDRSDVLSVFVGFKVPLWFRSKQNRKVAENFHRLEGAKAEYAAAKNEISFKIRDLVAKADKAAQLIELYRTGIIPQATQSLKSAIAAYEVSKIDFLALIDSQITLCNFETQAAELMAGYEKDLAALEFVVGKRIFDEGTGSLTDKPAAGSQSHN